MISARHFLFGSADRLWRSVVARLMVLVIVVLSAQFHAPVVGAAELPCCTTAAIADEGVPAPANDQPEADLGLHAGHCSCHPFGRSEPVSAFFARTFTPIRRAHGIDDPAPLTLSMLLLRPPRS